VATVASARTKVAITSANGSQRSNLVGRSMNDVSFAVVSTCLVVVSPFSVMVSFLRCVIQGDIISCVHQEYMNNLQDYNWFLLVIAKFYLESRQVKLKMG
jgi:hypothetical protein